MMIIKLNEKYKFECYRNGIVLYHKSNNHNSEYDKTFIHDSCLQLIFRIKKIIGKENDGV